MKSRHICNTQSQRPRIFVSGDLADSLIRDLFRSLHAIFFLLNNRLFMANVRVTRTRTLTGHRDCVYALSASRDPKIIFSGAGDGMIVKWDLTDPSEGEVVAKLPNSVYALNYSRAKDLLIVGHNREGIHVLNYQAKKEVYSLQLTKGSIFDIQSTGENVYVGTSEGEVIVVNEQARNIKRRLRISADSIRTIAINTISNEYAVGSSDNYIRTFDLQADRLKKEWRAHGNSVFCVCYSPDGRLLLSGGRDAHLKIWEVGNEYAQLDDIAAHLYAINHIAFSPDTKHFVTCSMDKSIKVWDASNGKLLKVIDKARHAGHGTSINKLLWTSFNSQLISASDDRTISVWDIFFEL